MAYYDDFPQYKPNQAAGTGWTWDRNRKKRVYKRAQVGAKTKPLFKKGGMYMTGGKYDQKD